MAETLPSDAVPGRWIVIGLGNEHRSDDRCGLEVVRRLRGHLPRAVRLTEGPRDALRLLDLWAGAGRAIVVDAMQGNGRPGSVRRFEIEGTGALGHTVSTSTHGLGLAEAIEIGRSLGRLPERLTVFGIEVAELRMGERLGPEVADAVERVAEEILREAERATAGPAA